MRSQAENGSPCVSEALQWLDRCVEICERLKIHRDAFTVVDSPLAALVSTQINACTKEIDALRNQVADIVPGLQQRDELLPNAEISQALVSAKVRLFETLELLEFYKLEERHGQDGALNALFASTHILNRNGGHDAIRAQNNEDKLIRVGVELVKIVDQFGETQTPVNNMMQQFRTTEIQSCLSTIAEQFRPRYIHMYKTPDEIPYTEGELDSLAKGSYGVVQKVIHKQSGEPFAMKKIDKIYNEKDKKRVLREIGVLENCFHQNLVRLIEALSLDGDDHCIRLIIAPWAPYTLTDFLRSPDAKRKIHCPWFAPKSPESNRCIYRIMYELADAVHYLHDISIKHKDLKPDNILLLHQENSNNVTPLITDVGISKVFTRGARTNPKDSTWEYLAPEKHSMNESTTKSDVWQLGCCFAELLAATLGGTTACESLQGSFIRDDENCQCSIALEHNAFTETLAKLCKASDTAQKIAYGVILGMLALDPSMRLDIGSVRVAISKLLGVRAS